MNVIKSLISLIAIIALVTLICNFAICACAEQYPRLFIVTNIDYDSDIVTFTDLNGEEWEWEGVEDWMVDDFAAAIMDDNGTPTIYDDSIIKIYYEGDITSWLAWDEEPTLFYYAYVNINAREFHFTFN
jgi:hypothetical protein